MMTKERYQELIKTDEDFKQLCDHIADDVKKAMNDTASHDALLAKNGIFAEALEAVRPNEITAYMLLNMPATMFELKTMSYNTWRKGPYYHENMIELWENAWEGDVNCKPASLFKTKAKWWIREFIQKDGTSTYTIIEVQTLKNHYEAIKHLQKPNGNNEYFRYINKGKGWAPCWCMRLNWFDGRILELEKELAEPVDDKLVQMQRQIQLLNLTVQRQDEQIYNILNR